MPYGFLIVFLFKKSTTPDFNHIFRVFIRNMLQMCPFKLCTVGWMDIYRTLKLVKRVSGSFMKYSHSFHHARFKALTAALMMLHVC
jgi:hypothetical protein